MKKKWFLLLLIPVVILLVIVIIFLVQRSKVEFYDEIEGTSVSIIGGADGPTSVFLAGKIGGSDSGSEETAEEINKMQIEIQIGDTIMVAELENNDAVDELIELLEAGEISMSASNYGGFEKVCSIGQSISRNDEQITTEPGDIMLYNGNQLVIFYDSNSWSYTPIGHIDASAEELEEFLSGNEDEVIIRLAE